MKKEKFKIKKCKLSYDFWDNVTRIIENDKNFLISSETLLLREIEKRGKNDL